ncbi:MAG: hypothetical protein IKG30_04845 [Clostridiales bacterium]|nr:hypothetical protein [Clostridiales bacterium]
MKTEIVSIFSSGDGRNEALELAEKTGAYCGLDNKSVLRLRLLSEELIELIRSLSEDLRGDFWLETKDKNVEIHLKTEIPMDLQTRNELLAVSSSGKNSAAKGLIGKIREMIAIKTLPENPDSKYMEQQALGLLSLGYQMGTYGAGTYSWSMNTYISQIDKADFNIDETKEAKDELEKSIVANLADEVKVNIVNSDVEATIYKSFD